MMYTAPDGRQLQVDEADTFFKRFLGLMGRKEAPRGLLLCPCSDIHMMFMRFSLDVVFLDKELRVVRVVRDLRPGKLAFGGKGSHSALELPASMHLTDALQPGMRVQLTR